MRWIIVKPVGVTAEQTLEMLGFIPEFLNEDDPDPARVQLDKNYGHGGGWQPIPKFTLGAQGELKYPGDPALPVLARTKLRDETINVYEHAWVAIIQPDGSFEVARMD